MHANKVYYSCHVNPMPLQLGQAPARSYSEHDPQ